MSIPTEAIARVNLSFDEGYDRQLCYQGFLDRGKLQVRTSRLANVSIVTTLTEALNLRIRSIGSVTLTREDLA